MFGKLLKSRRVPEWRPAVPDGQRIYAIGDIHGCDALLDRLLAMIDADDLARGPATTTLIFLGDLIDRGPASAQVLDRLVALKRRRAHTHVLLGNHEEVFLDALAGDTKALRLFCRIGGRETALSYGLADDQYEKLDYEELGDDLTRRVPVAHRALLGGCEDMVTIGDYVFVHAGVRPGTPLDQQDPSDLRWIREPFLNHPRPLAKMVVHGHTVSGIVDEKPHRIGIDTGAYASGTLTALGLEGNARWTLQT